jgi:branched-chain amino acid transport system permease protein
MGVNNTRIKVVAFVVGSALAGAAGVLYGHFEGFLDPKVFGMQQSFIILTMVVLGGTGSITGSAAPSSTMSSSSAAPCSITGSIKGS